MANEDEFQNQRAPWLTLDKTAEGSVTTPPDSGDVRVFIDSADDAFKVKDDAGDVTPLGLTTSAINVVFDAPSASDQLDVVVPFGCTITEVTLLADASGDIVIDIWKDTYANFPPTDADTITASAPPTLSSAAKSQDSTLSGWTTTITAGDVLRFNVDSVATVTRVTLCLKVTRTS